MRVERMLLPAMEKINHLRHYVANINGLPGVTSTGPMFMQCTRPDNPLSGHRVDGQTA